ncbi:hypothetical protein [Photobacterium profundum]|uniref:hypothetical protein n=1 Tax=Photobacterium profundum TaxID=74109 RepID=UPI003D12A20D
MGLNFEEQAQIEQEVLNILESEIASMSTSGEENPIERLDRIIMLLKEIDSTATGVKDTGLTHISDISKEWLKIVEARFNGELPEALKETLFKLNKP